MVSKCIRNKLVLSSKVQFLKMGFTKIKEYISTDDGVAGTLLIPKLILPMIQEEVDKSLIDRSLARWVLGPGQLTSHGGSFEVNQEVENTGTVREVGEGAEIPLDAKDYQTVTFTFKKYGVAVRITREMMEDSQFELLRSNIQTLGRRFAENENKLVIGALDGANTTVSGGAAVSIANITSAMLNLRNQDYTPTDLIVGNEVYTDLLNIDTFAEADKWGDSTSANRTGFIGRVYGLNVHVVSTNAGMTTTTAYVIDRTEAYGIAIKRDVTVENTTLPTYDMEGAVLTQRIDVQLLRSKAVSKITSS